MRDSDALFNLVHSLTRQEKRCFRIFTSFQNGEKNYLRLFEAVNNQTVYDEQKLLEHFSGEPFTRNFHVAKRYLFDLILKSLRSYRESRQPHFRLSSLLCDIELLYEKGLLKAARNLLRKARATAEYQGDYPALLSLIRIEEKIWEATGREISAKAFLERRQAIIRRIVGFSRLEYLKDRIVEVLADNLDYFRRVQLLWNIRQDPLLDSFPANESDLYKTIYFRAQTLYFFGLQDYEKSLEQAVRCEELFAGNASLIVRFPTTYTNILGNIITVIIQSGNKDLNAVLSGVVKKAEQVLNTPGISRSLSGELRVRLLRYRIVLHGRFGETEQCIALADEIENVLNTDKSYGSWFDLAHIYYFLSWSWFMQGGFSRAREYEKRITIRREPKTGKLFYYFLAVYRLILYFETGETETLKNMLRRMERSFRRRQSVPAIEPLLHSFFKKHIRITDRVCRAGHFRELLRNIGTLELDSNSRNYLHYFNVERWASGKAAPASLQKLHHSVPPIFLSTVADPE